MKKLVTLLFVALLSATGANAQREIPLVLGGGWNAGFVGESDVYSYTMNVKWLAVDFACNVSSADYPTYIVEFEEPLPENFQINYGWKQSAEDTGEANWEWNQGFSYGSTTKYVLNFNPEHPYITGVSVQHTNDVSAEIKIKKLTLVSKDGKSNLNIAPTFNNWNDPKRGTDDTKYYKGTVKYDKQWQQLKLNGVDGKKGVTIHVEFADNYENIQMCVDYEDDTSAWPQIGSRSAVTFTTKADAAIKNVGIQFNAADQTAQVTVNSATECVTYPTSTAVANEGSFDYWGTYSNNLTAVKLSDDVEVYNVTLSNEDNKLVFTKRADNKVAKGEGVLVKSTSASFGVEVIDEDLTKAEGNLLIATPTTDQVINGGDNTLYCLSFGSENRTNLGFYWDSDDGKSINSIPGKAYLAIPSSNKMSLRRSIVIGDSQTTSIVGPKAESVNQGVIYNLAGQRVNRLTKGVNIIGNKKVLVK